MAHGRQEPTPPRPHKESLALADLTSQAPFQTQPSRRGLEVAQPRVQPLLAFSPAPPGITGQRVERFRFRGGHRVARTDPAALILARYGNVRGS